MELFNKQLLVTIRSAGREERRARVNVTVEMDRFPGADRGRVLIVRLTDEADPFFLHTMRMTDDDFQVLKEQERLLVDFDAFPKHIVDFLDLCLAEEQKRPSKFILQLTLPENIDFHASRLEVIETSEFQHLTRLKLDLIPGNDADVKKFLADCLKTAKAEKCRADNLLSHTEKETKSRLQSMEETLQHKGDELNSIRNEWNSRTTELHEKYSAELSKEREKFDSAVTEMQKKFDSDRKAIETSAKRTISQLEAKNFELEAFQRDVTERRFKLEGAVAETKDRVAALEDELHRRTSELQSAENKLAELRRDLRDAQKSKVEFEEQCETHQEAVTRLQDRLNKSAQAAESWEKMCGQRDETISKLQRDYKFQTTEINKANEIIRRLQEDKRMVAEKLTIRSDTVVQQQKLVDQLKEKHEHLQTEITQLGETIARKDTEAADMDAKLKNEEARYAEANKALENNANMILWLNKQLNVCAGKSVYNLQPSATMASLNNGFADLNLDVPGSPPESFHSNVPHSTKISRTASGDAKSSESSSSKSSRPHLISNSSKGANANKSSSSVHAPVSALKAVSSASSYFN